jgi:hypothetical protein
MIMDEKFLVRIRDNANIYDLENVASYFKQRIAERARNNDRDGIGLEIIACLTFTAFAFEAQINFLGFKVVEGWDEWRPLLEKLGEVANKLNIKFDSRTRPYATIKELKEFRDTLAHGKPRQIRGERQLSATREELTKRNILKADWEKCVSEEFAEQCYSDADSMWKELLSKSGLEIFDTITSGGSNIQFIGPAN